jgi:cleavage stimulation factor subunit 2
MTTKDHETALSAVRNLNGTDVGGRPLRIDLADSDPFLEGKTTVRGELLDGGYPGPSEPRSRSRNSSHDPESFLANLPPGKVTPPGTSTLDGISQTLAGMPPGQLMEVLAQMKVGGIFHLHSPSSLFLRPS